MRSSYLVTLILFLNFKFIINSSKEFDKNKSQLPVQSTYNNEELTELDDDEFILSATSSNRKDKKILTSNQKQKPINCDRFDNEFFHYLLKRYNKDNQRNGRLGRLCNNLKYTATNCHKSNENLFKLIHQSNRHQFNEDDFNFSQSIIKLCPLVLFRLNSQQCIAKQIDNNLKKLTKPNPKHVWALAFLFVTIISCCSLVGVVVMPFANSNTESYKDAFNLFEGLAVGSLVASSLFHLLPQAFNLTSNKNDDYLSKAMLIFGGIYLFFWSEILMKLMAELRRRSNNKKLNLNLESMNNEMRANYLLNNNNQNGELEKTNGIDKKDKKDNIEPQQISNVAWMIIFGDGLHNFIDGLSIGAAFSESILSGISVSIAVICEELPHELGDFAVLIASGMTMKQAIGYNFLSACTCYIGVIVGILIGDLTKTSGYILALAGGMFLYVSLVNIMSELTNAIDEAFQKSKGKMFKVLLYQNIGILSGIIFLFLLAKYSESIRIDSLITYLII